MDTLAIIRAELQRQADNSRGGGLGCYVDDDPESALIDGDVDLVALATAIDAARVHVALGKTQSSAEEVQREVDEARARFRPERQAGRPIFNLP